MTEPTSVEKLTTWAAGIENRWFSSLRTTLGRCCSFSLPACSGSFSWIVCTFGAVQRLARASAADLGGLELPWRRTGLAEHERSRDRADLRCIRRRSAAMAAREELRRPNHTHRQPPATSSMGSPPGSSPRAFPGLHLLDCTCSRPGLSGTIWRDPGNDLVLFAMLFCLFLYFPKALLANSEDRSLSRQLIWDYYWGSRTAPNAVGHQS